ncbi:polymer-forming cytoskeletal protein [Halorubrum laminariae]|uniref:Polymer-forming cytoskeletal protein n=1 Tax=Halorubrum laminariae TaxID=1433523 RepID=A0ABD6C2C5_9EURY|nr:polymer-forming cytoskeletal protein [Halorubrum laminariae]
MSLRGGDPIDKLAVPSGTTVEEHDLVIDGDVLVGSQSTVEFGLRGRNVAIGERVSVGGDIEAEGDCRLDTWCSVDGNVLVGEDAYIGERVTVTGQLMVSGDLDIGDDVTIEEGFEANGWIVIRNPVPTLVFYFIVLSQLLRIGETDAADELATALADGDDVRDPLLVPRGAEISDDAWRVSTPATVGDDCRLHGNIRAESIRVGERNEVFGSLRAREGITVGADTVIHGDVTTRGGTVTVEAGARVLGDISAGDLVVHEDAEIDGTLRARGEMKLVQEVDREPSNTPSSESEDDEEASAGDEEETSDGDDSESETTEAESDGAAGATDENATPTADADAEAT